MNWSFKSCNLIILYDIEPASDNEAGFCFSVMIQGIFTCDTYVRIYVVDYPCKKYDMQYRK